MFFFVLPQIHNQDRAATLTTDRIFFYWCVKSLS